jgi:uncharacterized integral membrane protein
MNVKKSAVVIGIVVIAGFVLTNSHSVALRLFFWELSIPLIILLFTFLAIGFLIGISCTGILGKSSRD